MWRVEPTISTARTVMMLRSAVEAPPPAIVWSRTFLPARRDVITTSRSCAIRQPSMFQCDRFWGRWANERSRTAPVSHQKRRRQNATNTLELYQKARSSTNVSCILPLIMVWLQVRVLPGSPVSACFRKPRLGKPVAVPRGPPDPFRARQETLGGIGRSYQAYNRLGRHQRRSSTYWPFFESSEAPPFKRRTPRRFGSALAGRSARRQFARPSLDRS